MKNIQPTLKLLLIIIVVLSSLQTWAQDRPNKEKMEALKIAFITEKLDLSSDESKVFWPIYTDYQEERRTLRATSNSKAGYKTKPNFDEMNDSEIEKFVDEKMQMEEKSLALKRKYYEKIKNILPIKKVAQLSQIEKEFRQEVLKRLKDKN